MTTLMRRPESRRLPRQARRVSAPDIHVVGVGTIGAPLVRLLLRHRRELGLGAITFSKRTARSSELPELQRLISEGAQLAMPAERRTEFRALGLRPLELEEVLADAAVVLDCSPGATANRGDYDELEGARGFVAQGSESGFGKPYAWGLNDESLAPGEDRFLQVVSCNTHCISALIHALAGRDGEVELEEGRFLCIRRSSDVGQRGTLVTGPLVDPPKHPRFGSHHAHDVHRLFATLGHNLRVHSSALKVNSQYMHTLRFELRLRTPLTRFEALERLAAAPRIALTDKRSAARVFAHGREYGPTGRLLHQAVVPTETVEVHHDVVSGYAFTPQEGNSLLSSVAAASWLLDPERVGERMRVFDRYLWDVV